MYYISILGGDVSRSIFDILILYIKSYIIQKTKNEDNHKKKITQKNEGEPKKQNDPLMKTTPKRKTNQKVMTNPKTKTIPKIMMTQ